MEIPEGIEVTLDRTILTVKGKEGENQRNFANPILNIEKKDNGILLRTKNITKKEKRILNTHKSHFKNMIQGVQEKYSYQLKICSGHFPMTVTLENKVLVIKNFLGEKIPRKTKLPEDIEVKIEGDIINVSGTDKEKTSQTAAKIEQTTRITNRDPRIFQDGIWKI